MLTTHFDLVSSPLWVPGWLKKGYLALIPKIPRPNFVRDNFFSEHRLVGCPEHRSGMPYSSSTVIAHLEPPSVFDCIVWYCMLFHCIAWYCIVLHGVVQFI